MKVERLTVGYLSVNCYIVYDEINKKGIVIDPGGNGEDIIAKIKSLGIELLYIVFTHAHFDHILAYHDVKNAFPEAKLLLSHTEKENLNDREKTLLNMVNAPFPEIKGAEGLKDGDVIKFGDASLKVIETPGHTEGCICLYGEGVLFSGDTLFCGSIGRYDFPGGSLKKELFSIKEKLFKLPKDTVVLSGHGDKTTIGYEIEHNEVAGWM